MCSCGPAACTSWATYRRPAGAGPAARWWARPAPGHAAPRDAVGSVVIPAHDEATVIGRGLHRLLTSLGAGIEVVVVCNGGTDGTAAAARRTGDRVRVVELDVASKAAAC